MLIVSAVAITLYLIIRQSLEPVALVVCGMICAIELFVVAESAGFTMCSVCREEATDISTR